MMCQDACKRQFCTIMLHVNDLSKSPIPSPRQRYRPQKGVWSQLRLVVVDDASSRRDAVDPDVVVVGGGSGSA
jgi:hypothetical protein